jgi:hypothetical protein
MRSVELKETIEEIGKTLNEVLAGLFRWNEQTVNIEPYIRFVRLAGLGGLVSPMDLLRNDIGYSYRNLAIDEIGNGLVVVRRNHD